MANQNQNPEENLEDHTVAELKDMADEAGVQVPSHATKDEIIKALEKDAKQKGKPGGANADQQDAEVTPLALTGPVNILPLSGIVADVYGIGKKYNIALTDIQGLGAVLQGNLQLDILPPGEIMQIVRIKHSQSVAGPGITACTAQVTDNINAAFGAAFDVFQPVSNTALATVQLATANVGNFAVPTPVYLTLIAAGANLGLATAGAISVWLRYLPLA
jgi:hypothetical protein